MNKDTNNLMLSPSDIIAGFEERIAELILARDNAIRAGMKYKEDANIAERQYRERPFKDVKDMRTDELLGEIERRLRHYSKSNDYD